MGGSEILEDQQSFFVELRKQVKKHARKKPDEVKAAVPEIKTALEKQPRIARYVGESLSAQVEKVYVEMGGKPWMPKAAALDERHEHAHAHGQELHGHQ
jgi:hypothetical protein